MDQKKKFITMQSVSLVLNLTIVVMVVYSIACFFVSGGDGNMMVIGTQCFRFFTNLSNILSGISALVLLPFIVMGLVKGTDKIPQWAYVLKFVGTCGVTLTFITVVFFLGPTMGYGMMFAGPCLYLHALVPIIAILSYVLTENKVSLSKNLTYLGLLPTILYSIVYVIMVVAVAKWPDFYGFTFGGRMWVVPIVLIVMYAATFGIAVGLRALHNLCGKKL